MVLGGPMSRENNREDVTINGVEYMVTPGEEGYSKDFVRVQLQQQQIPGLTDQFTSRPDIRPMFQTSWSGGMRWELPLVSAESIDVYGLSEGFDMVNQPGNLYALPDTEDIAAGSMRGGGSLESSSKDTQQRVQLTPRQALWQDFVALRSSIAQDLSMEEAWFSAVL